MASVAMLAGFSFCLLATRQGDGGDRPGSEKLIGGSIAVGYMQISVRVDYGLSFQLVVRRD
jgi:hypothetical protein